MIVAGLGSIGSFIADAITSLDFDELTVIDYDKVEKKNIKNSIYEEKDIGTLKTEAFYEMEFKNSIPKIKTIRGKYPQVRGLNIKNNDLVLDCTDKIIPKKSDTQVCKIGMIGKSLCLDARDDKNSDCIINISCSDVQIDKSDVINASRLFIKTLENGNIHKIVENKSIVILKDKSSKLPKESSDNFLYQECRNHNQIKNIMIYWDEIVEVNKTKPIFIDVRDNRNLVLNQIAFRPNEVNIQRFISRVSSLVLSTNYLCEFTAFFDIQRSTVILYPYIFSA